MRYLQRGLTLRDTGRETPGPSVGDVSFVFRAYRYAPDGPEIQGRLKGKLG